MELNFSMSAKYLLKLCSLSFFGVEKNFSYLCKIGFTNKPDALTYAESKEYFDIAMKDENISVIITKNEIYESSSSDCVLDKSIVISENPKFTYFYINEKLFYNGNYYNESFSLVGKNTAIELTSIISDKNIIIGENCYIGHNTVILPYTCIGDNTIIRENCVIAGEGYEVYGELNTLAKHCGYVKIGNNVEIQALCHVAKSLSPGRPTIIGDYTKIDSGVHFQHGAQCGKNCKIASCAMIAGSATIGNNCWIAPQTAISSNIKIGNAAQIIIGSVVTKDVPENAKVSGNFAIDHRKNLEHLKGIR